MPSNPFDRFLRGVIRRIPEWMSPNLFTLMRGVLVLPTIAFLVFIPCAPAAFAMTLASSCCDILDGPLARAREETSESGAFFDAVSDKVYILGTLLLGLRTQVAPLFLWGMIVGELLLVLVRPLKRWLAARLGRHLPDANKSNGIGAAKTWAQTIGIMGTILSLPVIAITSFKLALVLAGGSLVGHLWQVVRAPKRTTA